MAAEPTFEADDFIRRMISTPLVDERLCRHRLGAGSHEIDAARLYLQIPLRARPVLS